MEGLWGSRWLEPTSTTPNFWSRPSRRLWWTDPSLLRKEPQHLCLDKGYDNPTGHAVIGATDYTPHVRRIGEEKLDQKGRKRHPARRWVVERTHGWLSKCRGILVRYSKKSCNYLAIIQLACGLLWYRRQRRLALLR